jgi:hypothetical protein
MKVRDLKDWPPQPASAFGKSYLVPTTEEAIIGKVVSVREKRITFAATASGNPHTYVYEAPSEKIALDLKTIIESNIGKSLISIGDAELPAS